MSALALGLLCSAPACTCGEPDPSLYQDEPGAPLDAPKSLSGVKFVESDKGDPSVIGCSDGQREGFADVSAFPKVAGCLGAWDGRKSLRSPPTGAACGDDKDVCTVPADVCAEGWHVCASNGRAADLRDRVDANSCKKKAGPGKFLAAMSHGQTQDLCPPPPTASTRFPCWDEGLLSESVCCGQMCNFGKCRDAVWRGKTPITKGKKEGCGGVLSENNGGVLCCQD